LRPLTPLEIHRPGQFGLNKQAGDGVLPSGWSTVADNLVYNSEGSLASRKGTKDLTDTDFSGAITTGGEYIDASATQTRVFVDDTAFYKQNGTTMTDITGSATAHPYKFVNFNGAFVGHHADYAPVSLATAGGTFAAASGTQYNGKDVLSAWGRLWILVGNTLRYSDLLINDFASGSAGSFDLASYWPRGMDESTGLAAWNDFLIVFGKESILIYENPDDPTTSMALADIIEGTGCIARDSIQTIGKDLLFLSASGVETLGRVIQEKSMPLNEISKNVRDDIRGLATSTETIKSLYSERERFYLLSFKDAGKVYCFDMSLRLEDGSYRATQWDMTITDMFVCVLCGTVILITSDGTNSQAVTYTGYADNVVYDGSGGETYNIDWEGVWNDFGQELSQRDKIFKNCTVLMGGVDGDTSTVKWAVDYVDTFDSATITFPTINKAAAGIRVPMTKSGEVVKIGIESTIYGTEKALKRINIMAKIGRYV